MAHHGLGVLNRIKIPQLTEHQQQTTLLVPEQGHSAKTGLSASGWDLRHGEAPMAGVGPGSNR